MLIEYDDMKEEIRNLKNKLNILNVVKYAIKKQWKRIVSVVGKILQIKIHALKELKKKKKNRIMLVSNCAVWGKVKSLFVKN